MAGETQIIQPPATTGPTITGTFAATTPNAVWPTWNDIYYQMSLTSAQLTQTTNMNITTASATTWSIPRGMQIWTHWTGQHATAQIYWGDWNVQYQLKADATEAEIKAMAERRRADEARWAERMRQQREHDQQRAIQHALARKRADTLLHRSLTPEQREDLKKKDCFYLETIDSKSGARRRYRIDRGTHGNVKLLDKDGRIIGQYCVQPNGVPTEDAMLAQKLWLETNEEAFIKVANFTPRRAA